MLRWIGAHDE
ncbi:hypothetical protein EYF80_063918 [Liparis tanakae]|uniref:Uncharacterized protein n=1 Tax=Liparis tanakae TaxID=230148 RepID=A0A4Z2EAT1_9TELE|nr:hypothetical protein EYF80_063918 [Liparis tanakae]